MVALSPNDQAVAARVVAAVAQVYDVAPIEVVRSVRSSAAVADAKRSVALVLHYERGWPLTEVGAVFGRGRYQVKGRLEPTDDAMRAAVAAGTVALTDGHRLRPLEEIATELYRTKQLLRRLERELYEWQAFTEGTA